MPICILCQESFSAKVTIDGVEKRVHRRKYCLTCSPLGSDNQRKRSGRKPEPKEAWNARQNKRRRSLKQKCVELLGGKCVVCGYQRYVGALEFHHINPQDKSFPLDAASIARRTWQKVVEELHKCILVCSICHKEIEGNIIDCPEKQ